jgi:hypothetical protein
MGLTDAEREEFDALLKDSYDPDLWDESELPVLRAARVEYEREQAQGRRGPPSPTQPPDSCPAISIDNGSSESEKQKHAESMTDEELVRHVESRLRPVGRSLRNLIPYIQEAHARYAHPGRRVPVPGEPTFGEWIRQNLGVSDRHVRRLLAAAREPTDSAQEDDMEPSPKQRKRDEAIWKANRLAHAVLGLDEFHERDPAGVNRRAALTAMAYEFLNLSGRKHFPLLVRVKELQPGDWKGLCTILLRCFEPQINQVFAPLDDQERTEAARCLIQLLGGSKASPQ